MFTHDIFGRTAVRTPVRVCTLFHRYLWIGYLLMPLPLFRRLQIFLTDQNYIIFMLFCILNTINTIKQHFYPYEVTDICIFIVFSHSDYCIESCKIKWKWYIFDLSEKKICILQKGGGKPKGIMSTPVLCFCKNGLHSLGPDLSLQNWFQLVLKTSVPLATVRCPSGDRKLFPWPLLVKN